MKCLEYQEDTVERFTSYLETLVAKRDAAEKFAELARQNQMEPPVVDWCGQTWDALKASGVLPKAKDASGALFVPPWLPRADGVGRPVPNVCLKLPTGAGKTYIATRGIEQLQRLYFAEIRAELNQSHVFVHRQNVAEAVTKVREGLSSEGMGDLGELVRAAGTTSTGGNVVTVEVERRAPFRRRIFLPRILAREGDDWRLFDYESDLFPCVPWETLEWTKASEFSPDDASSLAHTRVAVDVDQLGPDPTKPLGVAEAGDKPDLDFPALARLLADVIPNPWQAARILRGALASLRARDFTEDQLLASRYRLIEKMRTDLMADIHVQTERIFCDLLADGGLSFRLEGRGLSWELVEKLAFEVTQPPDYQITHKGNGQPVEKSLFEQIWSRHFNGLEKDVALYIDDVKAVRWWHRIAVQADWYLDGWKKKKVFPDFLVALEETKGKPSKLVVVETKGFHLKNEDTEYKRKLFETLERHSDGGVPVGEFILGDAPGPMRFRLVLEEGWKSQVDAALLVEDPAVSPRSVAHSSKQSKSED